MSKFQHESAAGRFDRRGLHWHSERPEAACATRRNRRAKPAVPGRSGQLKALDCVTPYTRTTRGVLREVRARRL